MSWLRSTEPSNFITDAVPQYGTVKVFHELVPHCGAVKRHSEVGFALRDRQTSFGSWFRIAEPSKVYHELVLLCGTVKRHSEVGSALQNPQKFFMSPEKNYGAFIDDYYEIF